MNIALISPKTHKLQHRVRGSGFYIENLKKNLIKYDNNNKYSLIYEGDLISEKIDLVHYAFFEPFFKTLPLFKKKKTVVTVHDLTPLKFPKYFPKGLRGSLKWQIQKLALKNADAIITDSYSSQADILKFVGIDKNKTHVIYLAAGKQFKQLKSVRSKYNLPEKFALYVGDVTWNKNLPRLIEAIKKANIHLVLVGKALVQTDFDKSNPWNQDLKRIKELIEDDKLFIKLGFVNEEDLITLYNLATIFVMPSLYEGFGLPILEAMNCGCPVVTSREGSIPEVAGDAAFYVDAYDVDSISAGIKKVFSDRNLREKLVEKGFVQAKKFSWEKTAKETIRVYDSI